MKKLTIEYIKRRTKELADGYTCLSDAYINANEKLKFKCDKGHIYETSWHSFQSGRRCLICARNVKFTIDWVKEETSKILPGYVCLSNSYVNNRTKLKFRCNKGHEYETTWDVVSKGHRCKLCTVTEVAFSRRFTIEYIAEMVSQLAPTYTLLSKEYVNSTTNLIFKCDNRHIYESSWTNFRAGKRCPYCAGKNKTIEDIRDFVLKNAKGYECLSKIYKNSKSLLEFKCDNGHIYKTSWGTFYSGARCPMCSINAIRTIEYIKEMVPKLAEGYVCLSSVYIDYTSKLIFKCNKGHIYKTAWMCFQRGSRCPKCAVERRIIRDDEALQNITWYRAVVTRYSNENYIEYFYDINPNKLPRSFTEYHLDHIFTVIDGFNEGILPQVIANPTNLQMLSATENIVKNGKSDITKEELFLRFSKFINRQSEN